MILITRSDHPFYPNDFYINFIASGFVLPTAGALVNYLTAGILYVNGQRVYSGGDKVILRANRDNYIDRTVSGPVITSVAIDALSPAVVQNGIRLGYIRTNANGILFAVATGKDSNGNWMHNTASKPTCLLSALTNQLADPLLVAFDDASNEVYDNAYMHSVAVNPSRITITQNGLYDIHGSVSLNSITTTLSYLNLYINGVSAPAQYQDVQPSTGTYQYRLVTVLPLVANDYIELAWHPLGSGGGTSAAFFGASMR